MRVRILGTYGYRGRFDWEWNDSLHNPSWADVEAALRRLDAAEYAGVVLHLNECRPGEAATDCLAVSGGPAGYLVTWRRPGGGEVVLVDPERPEESESVGVVQRDQGIWVPARMVCRDLELVVAVARHYSATGCRLPSAVWEE
jgi:hypothetical protein